ncbi:MAG: hypothetical protein ACM3RP_08215 [Chitinophagales bacterium]
MSKWAKHPLRAVAAAACLFLAVTLMGTVRPVSLREPGGPASSPAAEITLRAYFGALAQASNLTPEQMGAAGGTVGLGEEPLQTAYSYLGPEWRAAHPFAEFKAGWRGTAGVELQRLIPAGLQDGGLRYFVETRNLEITGEKPRPGYFWYSGFVLMKRAAAGGWVIADQKLSPEELAFKAGGHSPWRGDAELVARQALGGRIDAPLGQAKLTHNADGTVTVHFSQPGQTGQGVVLVQRYDGIWTVIRQE